VKRLRYAVERGKPFGTETRTRETATRLGLESCLQPRGRLKRSGSGEASLLPRPLRTVREACASYGSSVHKRPSRDAAVFATAFTIRAWSRRTVRQTFFPPRECQSGVRPGAAPASISAADISACLPESVSRGSLVTEHLREVSPLSR